MMQARNLGGGQHCDNAKYRRAEDGHLQGGWQECRPAPRRPATNVEWIIDDRRVPLQRVGSYAAKQPPEQGPKRDMTPVCPQCVAQALYSNGRISLNLRIARIVLRAAQRDHELPRIREFGEQPIERRRAHGGSPTSWGTNLRNSNIETTGRRRTNRRNKRKNRPIDPARKAMSQNVG